MEFGIYCFTRYPNLLYRAYAFGDQVVLVSQWLLFPVPMSRAEFNGALALGMLDRADTAYLTHRRHCEADAAIRAQAAAQAALVLPLPVAREAPVPLSAAEPGLPLAA